MTTPARRNARKFGPAAGALVLSACLSGCVSMKRGFDSPEPAARMDAAVDAARRGDRNAIPDLVRLLDSDDPATRVIAIRSLERLTGTTHGYDATASDADRRAAVERWQQASAAEGMPRSEAPRRE